MPWKSLAILDITGQQVLGSPDWPVETLTCGPLYPQPLGSGRLLDQFPNRVVKEDGAVFLYGPDVPRFAAQFDMVISWKWFGQNVIQEIRKYASTAVKVGFACTYESMNQTRPWDECSQVLWDVLNQYKLRGIKQNSLGSEYVDIYEATPIGSKNHSFQVDIAQSGLADIYSTVLDALLTGRYRTAKPDLIFFDCMQERPYWGTATNAPPFSEDSYRNAWTLLLQKVNGLILPTYGHNPGYTYYPDLMGRIHEHFPSSSTGSLRSIASMASAICSESKTMERVIGMGWERSPALDPWLRDQHLWNQLYSEAHPTPDACRDDRVYVMLARVGKSFGLFHPGQQIVHTGAV